jgi:glycosyltransferase involved in cell wall biosynthesis
MSGPCKRGTLYICYQSITEPLTQSQVVAYLEGLAADGLPVTLLTFEPRRFDVAAVSHWAEFTARRGIEWEHLPYHKWPSVPATLWDVFAGSIAATRILRRKHLQFVHARSHVAGVMSWIAKRVTGAKLIFDVRGLMAEEYVSAGVWKPDSLLPRFVKRIERRLISVADAVVVLTHAAKRLFLRSYPRELADKPFVVIPCCVDMRDMTPPVSTRRTRGDARLNLVYVGKLRGWYWTEALLDFVQAAHAQASQIHLQVWTQDETETFWHEVRTRGLQECVSVGTVAPHDLLAALENADAGLSFRREALSNIACSPTKVGEYLAAGLPVITNAGIGDVDELLRGSSPESAVGIVVEEMHRTGYESAVRELFALLLSENLAARCCAVARTELDLVNLGWPRYRDLYKALGAKRSGSAGLAPSFASVSQ